MSELFQKILAGLFLIIFCIGISVSQYVFAADLAGKVVFFWGRGCSHCAKVDAYVKKNNLDEIFNIERKEIYFNEKNREEFNRLCDEHNLELDERGVPMAVINGECVIGDKLIIDKLNNEISELPAQNQEENSGVSQKENFKNSNVNTDGKLTLPIILGAAAVDAVNPCAFAVLIILVTTILASGNRRRALSAGLAFALSIFISYLLMGVGLYQALATAGLSNWFMKFIAGLAIVVGLLNIKDYFWYGGGGFIMEVPLSWRPKMKLLINSVTSPWGAFAIGFLVSLFLLPCTSGPYIVILGMLSQKEAFFSALGWLLLYNFIFILPMIIITLAVYKGFSPEKAEEARQKRLRVLHLIAGVLMIGIGMAIVFNLL